MDRRLRLSIIIGFILIFMSGCAYKSALELINKYDCNPCVDDDCAICVDGVCTPCEENEYICCKYFVPEEHRYIFDCAYEPLIFQK